MKNISIRLDHVSVDVEGKRILSDIDLTFQPKKTTVLLGTSGSGKSILLKIAAGLFPPTEGAVWVNDLNLLTLNEKEESEFRRSSGFVFQDAALWANRSVFQNVEFPLEVHYPHMEQEVRKKKVEAQLERTGYWDSLHYRPSQISTGEQKMVSLARALVTEPELLFLDDPLVSIDSGSAETMMEVIKQLHKRETTLIGSFASAELISLIADDLVVLHKGEVIISGPFREVRNTDDPTAKKILAALFNEAASFDEDILELIDGEDLFS
jgi:ABC-type transporter Mla maintaining outer membrane lipid asymmetry ATPase subunit MlaF